MFEESVDVFVLLNCFKQIKHLIEHSAEELIAEHNFIELRSLALDSCLKQVIQYRLENNKNMIEAEEQIKPIVLYVLDVF